MILNWTSSINQNALPEPLNVGESWTYEDLQKFHIWNLYLCLKDKAGWTPVSSSFRSGASYATKNAGWDSISELKFEDKMTDNTFAEIKDKNGVYTPKEHCWVTLSKTDSLTNKPTYLTIDLRYPLPPHKRNVGIVINADSTPYEESSYDRESAVEDSGDSAFVGLAAVKGSTYTVGEKPDVSTAPWDEQDLDFFYGLTERDNSALGTRFRNFAKFKQTHNSRTAAFVDITLTGEAPLARTFVAGDPVNDYYSATTRVRPRSDKEDREVIYSCWAYSSIPAKKSELSEIGDQELSKFKYHFHWDPSTNAFLYQISTRDTKEGFDSMIGALPIQNASPIDAAPYSLLTIGTDPGFNYKSLCVNSDGATLYYKVTGLESATAGQIADKIKYAANTFYNVCYRNYNFSDGVNNRRYGDIKQIGQAGNLPVTARLAPSNSVFFASPKKGIVYGGANTAAGAAVPKKKSFVTDQAIIKAEDGTPLTAVTEGSIQILPSDNKYTILDKLNKFNFISLTNSEFKISTTRRTNSNELLFAWKSKPLPVNDLFAFDGDSWFKAYKFGSQIYKKSIPKSLNSTKLKEWLPDIQNRSALQPPVSKLATNAPAADRKKFTEAYVKWAKGEEIPADTYAGWPHQPAQALEAGVPRGSCYTLNINLVDAKDISNPFDGIQYGSNFEAGQNETATDEAIVAASLERLKNSGIGNCYFSTKDFLWSTIKATSEATATAKEANVTLQQLTPYINDKPCRGAGSEEDLYIYAGKELIGEGFAATVTLYFFNTPENTNGAANLAADTTMALKELPAVTAALTNKILFTNLVIASNGKFKHIPGSNNTIEQWLANIFGSTGNIQQIGDVGEAGFSEKHLFIKTKRNELFFDLSQDSTGLNLNPTSANISSYMNARASEVNIESEPTVPGQVSEKQNNGAGAMPVFKTLTQTGETGLIIAKYNFAMTDSEGKQINPSYDIFETAFGSPNLDMEVTEQVISLGKIKNTVDNSYSELPAFAISSDPDAPTMKGYISDVTLGPTSVPNGSLVANTEDKYKVYSDANPTGAKAKYQKLFWKGWWLPWIADESADW